MRINKFLSEHGVCSRREADRLIESSRVTINGKNATLGDQVEASDVVTVDGKLVTNKPRATYIMYNKPLGVVCTLDAQEPDNLINHMKYPHGRIFNIGRLDKYSHGLLLLTNDGDIVNKVLRAQHHHEKEYIVHTMTPFDDSFLKAMASGVDIGDHVTQRCPIERINRSGFKMILTEGKNRQIRRMVEVCGHKVRHLQRVRIMNVELGDLPLGAWKEMSGKVLKDFLERTEKS